MMVARKKPRRRWFAVVAVVVSAILLLALMLGCSFVSVGILLEGRQVTIGDHQQQQPGTMIRTKSNHHENERSFAEALAELSSGSTSQAGTDRQQQPEQPPTTLSIYQDWAAPLPRQRPGTVRLVVLSDTHGQHGDLLPSPLPRGDVLIHLGDVADRGSLQDIRSFVAYVRKQQELFEEVILLEGNHDRDLTTAAASPAFDLASEYGTVGRLLKDQIVRVARGRLTLLGVSWDACARDDFSAAQQQAAAAGPSSVDVLLTHCPPPSYSKRRAGNNLSRLSKSVGAAVHLFGHIHRRRGIVSDGTDGRDDCVQVNCSSIPANRPVVLDWDPISKRVAMIHCPRHARK